MEQQKQRVIVYIDGFNFYFGLKHNTKWKKYYWLDIVKLFESFMRPNQELVAVKYFSAKPDDLEQSLRQNAFFQANRENLKFKLILGKYLKKEITCFRCGNVIHTYEEKETDVRIATQIVADAYQNNCDLQIVVSNLAAMGAGKPLHMKQYETRFKQCLLPDVVHLEKANFDLHIPEKWKGFQSL